MGNWNNPRPALSDESCPIVNIDIYMKKTKVCDKCFLLSDKLFRCRYGYKKEWVFLCQTCLDRIKSEYSDSYQYGGTKKIRNI